MEVGTNKSFKKVLESAMQISKATTGLPCTRAQELASDFLTKNVMTSTSLWTIFNPPIIKDFPSLATSFQIHDFPSANVLIRSLFEAYINMNYLLIDPATEEEREFRLDLWDRHALAERQKMANTMGSKHPKVAEEKRRLDELSKKILSSAYFNRLPLDQRQSVQDSYKWTRTDVLTRADKAQIHRSQSEFIYKFLSNYSHSEAYALMQIYSVKSATQAKALCDLPRRFCEMFLALTINTFAQIVLEAKELLEKDMELKLNISIWEKLKRGNLKEIAGLN